VRLGSHRRYSVTARKIIDIVAQGCPIFLCLGAIIAPNHDLIDPSAVVQHLLHLRLGFHPGVERIKLAP